MFLCRGGRNLNGNNFGLKFVTPEPGPVFFFSPERKHFSFRKRTTRIESALVKTTLDKCFLVNLWDRLHFPGH